MIYIGIALGFSLLYLLLQLRHLYHWNRIPIPPIPNDFTPTIGVTIVIVARNEEKLIGQLLKGIFAQRYPSELMEIIVIDDHSTDGTLVEIRKIGNPLIRVLALKDYPTYIQGNAFKKSGITLAVDKASFDTVVVTDADCEVGEDWLSAMVYQFQESALVFQTAPVLLHPGKTMLLKMQEMEQLILMLITGFGIKSRQFDLANGANMAFRKSAFLQVNGFEGNFEYASGDDMFLIEKMRTSFPDQIRFVKSLQATVYTEGKKEWASLLKQRLRWAGKNKGLKNKSIQSTWYFVGFYHVLLLTFLCMALFQHISWWPFISMLAIKWIADFLLVKAAATFFKRTALLNYFIPLQFYYSFYVIRLGLLMMNGSKGDWERN